MKIILIVLTLIFIIATSRADLVMELNYTSSKIKLVVNIKEDKIRYDVFINQSLVWSLITDLKTGDVLRLDHSSKTIVVPPPISPNYTNAIAKAQWPKLQDVGKSEILNGYDTKVYEWTNFYGEAETLWIATNYPNFEKIRSDLVKLDLGKVNGKKIWLPEFSSLSGMPLKLVIAHNNSDTNERSMPITLLSAKEEPIDDSVFEVPKDYHFYSTNAPATNANEANSPTNVPTSR